MARRFLYEGSVKVERLQTTKNQVPSAEYLMTRLLDAKMADGQESARRGQLELMVEILNETFEPVKKTHIMYKVRLNYYQLAKYLGLLLKLGMIEEISEPFDGFRIADKGRLFLKLLATVHLDNSLSSQI